MRAVEANLAPNAVDSRHTRSQSLDKLTTLAELGRVAVGKDLAAQTQDEKAWFEADRRLRENALEKEGGFKKGDPRGFAFANARLAAGATELRNMIVDAWQESATTPAGYPMVNVRDIESGKVRATRDLFGAD